MHLLHLPRLGQTMQAGTVTAWLVEPGVSFEIDVPLLEIETDKNSIEIVAKLPGTIIRVVAPVAEELPIGALLAVVADPGEDPAADAVDALVEEDLAAIAAASPPTEQSTAAAPSPVQSDDRRVRAVPKARALASSAGIALEELTGTGDAGSITVTDVEAAISARSPETSAEGVAELRPFNGVRRAMAAGVTASWRDVPQFVQQVRADATALQAARSESARAGVRVSVTDLLVAAVAAAARDVPEANSRFQDDAVAILADVNVTIAVDTEAGLLVPVVRHADRLTVAEIAEQVRDLSQRARERQLRPDDVVGGTITVSNLGATGVETGMPLVPAPQATIVFAGSIIDTPVVVEGQVVVRPLLGLAFGYDHRILNGATAARFTAAVKSRLEAGPTEDQPAQPAAPAEPARLA